MEMVDSLDELRSSRSTAGKNLPNFEMLDFCIEQDHPEFLLQKEGQSRGAESPRGGSVLTRKTVASMIYDYFRVTSAHDTALDYADFFSVTHHDNNVQEFDTRWDEVLLSTSKIPSDDVLESLYKLRKRESAQLNTVLELYDMEIHRYISMLDDQKLKTMAKRNVDQKLRLRSFDARHGKIETGTVVKNRRDKVALKEEKVLVISGKKKAIDRRETSAVSGMRVTIVHNKNRTQMPPHLLSHQ